ncbi:MULTISPECIES: hypothetical protein [Streptomyces]|uniref:hypothetical protein n=1 Tax=Streptomyces TaxID=1883 RepID=UPI000CF211B6|nr:MULTISPECIES: hypothetical protein [Streptomyces]
MASNQQTRPGIGELAKDTAKGRIGIVMCELGGRVQIRPIGGGRESPERAELPPGELGELIEAMLSHTPEDRPTIYEVGKALS